MQNFQELRFADLAQRLLREVTRLVRPARDARQILLATPPNDPNQLGLAILELLLFTEGINCLTLGAGVPAQEIAGAATAYEVGLVVLLFERGISGKIVGQEIRALRCALPENLPLVCSGRAVTLLAKPIPACTPRRTSLRSWRRCATSACLPPPAARRSTSCRGNRRGRKLVWWRAPKIFHPRGCSAGARASACRLAHDRPDRRAALAYVIWRGYQMPDFLLDLAAFRLC